MAQQEHLDLIKQGVEAWNNWRNKHPRTVPDLRGAHLSRVNLGGTYFSDNELNSDINENEARVVISYNLNKANLSNAYLRHADLSDADFDKAKLHKAKIAMADLSGADLSNADLSEAELQYTNLYRAILVETDFTKANLVGAQFTGNELTGANFSYAIIGDTHFSSVDLRQVKGLETARHTSPSYLSTSTLELSEGCIPEIFLRGAGLSDSFIEYARALTQRPIEYYTCFISYSSKDQDFAERLYADLQNHNVRCWYAPEDLKIGDEFRTCIDESIRLHDKLLLVLSQHSVMSHWVKKEVETAFEKEHRHNKSVLFPIMLDDTVMRTTQAWAADISRTRHIGDFTHWKEHDAYQKGLQRLLRDLKADKTRHNV